MPAVVQMLTASHVMRQEAIIDIALHGTFDELSALVMTDPLCSRLKMGECRSMVREMLQANRELIQNPRLLE
jgi:alpha-galactosidase/6-phospho-beta-glucosidase family protein